MKFYLHILKGTVNGMHLFTIGPVEMYEHTLQVRSQQIPYFRTDEFSQMNCDTDRMLKQIIGTEEESKVIYLTASGTAAMEATVMNCLDSVLDNVLVIEGGTFGKRFSQICEVHSIKHSKISLEFGEKLTREYLEQFHDSKFTAMLVNLHETSTGQLYDIKMLSDFCHSRGMYLIVDAISTFLCDQFEMDRYGIDVAIISTQKGMCLSPGMSMIILNERIVEERVSLQLAKSVYFNFSDYIQNMERGQTPFTPSVGLMYEMNDMLKRIMQIGLENFLRKIKDICFDFRNRLEVLPVSIPAYPLSNAITPVIFEEPIAQEIYQKMVDNDKVYVNPTGGELGKRMFRVAHIGNQTIEDNKMLIGLLEKYLNQKG